MKSSGHMGLYALLRHSSSNELQMARQMIYLEDATTLHVEKRTSETGRTMVEALKAANELLPFFMLDEMSPNVGEDAGGLNMAAFQRNVFRACGLVVIVMGTDSKISKLVSQTSGSYNKEHKWMSIVPKFHPYQIVFDNQQDQKVWKAIVARFSVVGYIAMNSRGRFAIYFVDEVVKVVKDLRDAKLVKLWDLLDEVFDRVSKDTQRREGFMKTRDGDYAQLMAIPFTNAKREEEPPLKKKILEGTESMQLHFASLTDKEITDVALLTKTLWTESTESSEPWTPKWCFPSIDKDLLLCLAVLGGKANSGYYAYTRNGGVAYSTKFVFTETGAFYVHENTSAVSNDYKTYENMVAHACFCSSRRNGVRGILFDDFLACLVGKFRDESWKKTDLNGPRGEVFKETELLANYDKGNKNLSMRTIPFLAPPNGSWSPKILDLNHQGCKFGRLVRSYNSDRCDIYLTDLENRPEKAVFLGECKYHANNVGMSVLESIVAGLEKVWKWKVSMLFCQQLANVTWTCDGVDCMRIDCQTGICKWVNPIASKPCNMLGFTNSVQSNYPTIILDQSCHSR